MKNFTKFFLSLLCIFLLVSCGSTEIVKKGNEEVRVTVYEGPKPILALENNFIVAEYLGDSYEQGIYKIDDYSFKIREMSEVGDILTIHLKTSVSEKLMIILSDSYIECFPSIGMPTWRWYVDIDGSGMEFPFVITSDIKDLSIFISQIILVDQFKEWGRTSCGHLHYASMQEPYGFLLSEEIERKNFGFSLVPLKLEFGKYFFKGRIKPQEYWYEYDGILFKVDFNRLSKKFIVSPNK